MGVDDDSLLVRAGRHSEHEKIALDRSLALIGWAELPDLSEKVLHQTNMLQRSFEYLDVDAWLRSLLTPDDTC